MITLLHTIPVWLPQTETWIYNQVHYLQSNVETHIICETTKHLDQFQVPNIHSLWEASRWRYFLNVGMRKLELWHYSPYSNFVVEQAKHNKAQLLHSHFGNLGWSNLKAAAKAKLKHIVTFYGYDVNYLPKQDLRWHKRYQSLFEEVNCVLCEGSHMAQCIVALGCPANKIEVHHLGVEVDKIAYQPRVWNAVKPLRVLIAASFREKKGIPYALEALGQLQHEIPLEITIIGDANKDPRSQAQKQKILDLITKHNLHSKIRLLGYQPYSVFFKEAYNHHIFLSPSVTASDGDTEGGLPVTLIEVAATGMPIVSTTHCDIPELIEHGVTGLLAEERDVYGLVSHLKWLIERPQHWSIMLEKGRKKVEMEYDVQKQGKKLTTIYQNLI
jgi:colanic acid/amylovoran biosynthesis glycosyltransferase